jgi:DNA-binding PadR family transcriptional regulator
VFAPGDLKLLLLALIAEQPCHGYDLIRQIEGMFDGAYSPSPGVIYPTLTFLEESDLISGDAEAAKTLQRDRRRSSVFKRASRRTGRCAHAHRRQQTFVARP